MAEFDEEIRRQAAISALLAQDDPAPSDDSYAASMAPSVVQPDDTADYHKWVNSVFDTTKDDRDPSIALLRDHPNISPPPPLNIPTPTPESPSGSTALLKTDQDTGTQYVEDEGTKIPHAELATPADEAAFKPSDVVLPQIDVTGQGAPIRVERGEEITEPWHPSSQTLQIPTPTPESPSGPVPKPIPGFVEGSQNAIVNPAAGVIPPTPVAPTIASDQPAGPPTSTNVIDPRIPTSAGAPAKVKGGQGFFGGDLSQGPPGTKPDGTDDEPYWPKTDKDVALLPPGANYIDPKDQSQKVTPGTPAPVTTQLPNAPVAQTSPTPLPNAPVAQTSPTQLPNAPVDRDPSLALLRDRDQPVQPTTTEEYSKLVDSWFPSADSKAKTTSTATSTTNPDGTPFPTEQAPNGQQPAALIIHHTGGRGSPASVVDGWHTERPGVGSQFIMDRDGVIHDTQAEFGYGGTGHFLHSVIPGVSNQTAVGIEVIAKDDADMTDAQLESLKKFAGPGGPYSNVAVYGHSQVSPSDRENEGVRGVAAINEARAAGPTTSQTGEPGTTPIETLVKLDQSGLNVTHFGYPGDETPDKDSAAGHGKYVENMIPGYDVALNAQAAVMVGSPKPGETFQFAGKEWRYGDAVPEKYSDPRFDIYDSDGNVLTGAAPVGRQVATAAEPKEQSLDDLVKDWVKLSPEDQAAAEAEGAARVQAKQQAETAAVYKLPEAQNSNIIGLYNRLETSVPDVSDQTRSQIQAKLKPEIIAQMRAKFPEIKTDDEAWAKAREPVNALDVGQEWGSKAMGFVQQFTNPMKVGAANTDQFSVDQFLNKAMPGASDADKHAYLTKLYGMPVDQRASEIAGRLGPGFVQPGNPYRDPFFLAQALDRLSDPNFQKRQADDVAKFQEEMRRNVSSDPRLVDTGMDRIVNDTAQIPAAVAAFSNPALWPMALAQVHDQVTEGFKKEHPEWDAKTLQEKSTYATLTQFFGGLVAGHVMSAGAGALMEGIEGKASRAIAQAVFGGTTNALIGGTTQLGTNLIAGDSPSKNVGEATLSGLIQGTATGVGHGVGELTAPKVVPEAVSSPLPEQNRAEPVTPPVGERPPVAEPATETVPPPVRPVSGEEQQQAQQPPRPFPTQEHANVYDDLVSKYGMDPDAARTYVNRAQGKTEGDILEHVQAQMRAENQGPTGATPPAGEPEPVKEAPISYQHPAPEQVPPELSKLVPGDSLRESALLAAKQVQDPAGRELAQKIANLVPENSKISVADFSQPVIAGGKQYSGELSAGLYHPDSDTALISHVTSDPVASIIHEATHAALNNAIVNPESLTPEARRGVNDIHEAYHDTLQLAPVKRPPWMGYALSSPEEFTSAVVSDPRFQKWLASKYTTGGNHPFDQVMRGAAQIFGRQPKADNSFYERAIAGIGKIAEVPPHETRGQGPIYAANPHVSAAGKKALPRWMSNSALEFRRRTMTMRSNLDAVPETRSLSQAMDYADDTKDALLGKRISTIAEIKRLAKGKESQVTREFQRMAEQIDKGLKPTTTDPATLAIREKLVQHSAEDAAFMRQNEFHVQTPDGSWRPFVGFADPAQYIPRAMREDVYEALRAPRDPNGNYTPEFIKLFNEGLGKGFFKTPEDLEKYVPHVGQGLVQGPRQTSLETARTIRLPSFFFDYNIDAQVRNLYTSADTRARLEAFGQSRPGVPDKFQKTVAEINASTRLTAHQKEIAVLAVKRARDEWYHHNSQGVDSKIIAFGKGLASASQTGNYYTSSKVALARYTSTIQNKGLVNSVRALIHTIGHYSDSHEASRDLGVLKDTISFQAENLRNASTMYKKFMHGFKLMQEVALHGEANRFFTMTDTKASQLWLASAVREIQKSPNSVASRMAKEIFARRRVDLDKMLAGDIPETHRFLRQWVNDTQVSYRIMDNPVWSKTPFGKIILQYMPEAYNQTRMLFNETMIPAVKALSRGDSTLGGAYVGRLMFFAAASAGSEELLKEIRDKIFGRDPTAASWGQFAQALHDNNGGLALKVFMERMRDDLVGGVFLGVLGEYARGALNYVSGRNEVAHVWNPNNPPALSVVEQGFELFSRWKDQGGKLSDQDIARFLGNISSMEREVKNIAYSADIGLKQLTGMQIPLPGLSEAKGYRERSFAQAKLRQFFNEHPDMEKAHGQFRSGPKTPYYANVEDALYAGNVDKAKQIIAEMKLRKLYDQNGLKSSITLRQPIPSGVMGFVFSKWADKNLTEAEWNRIVDSQNAYVQNAYKAGIFGPKDIRTHAPGAAPKGKKQLKQAITELQLIND